MAANKPILPRPPFPPGTYPGAQSRDLERVLANQRAALQKLFEGRADGVLALDAPPSGTWEQGALVRAADPKRTISASTTWVVLGWLRADEGSGTLTWQELRIWETAGGGGGGGFAATSMTATTTGVGTAVYAGNPAGELLFRNVQAGTGISLTVSAGAIRITNTSAAGGFAATSQTATSTGTGVDVYVGNPAGELTFRKVQAGANISVTTSAGAIRIASTGGGLTAASITATNTGSGESVYAGNSGTELVFRKLQEGTGISLTQSAGAVKITATRYGSQIGTYGWRDNLSALSAAAVGGGVSKPSWGTIRDGLQGWLFSPTADNELWISFHIDHDYAAGTALFPHIHVVPITAGGGVTRWGIEYSFAKGHNQASFGPSTTIYLDGTITAGSQYRHYIFETSTLSAISGADIETDGILLCRIFRNASDPGDTFSTTVAAIFADLHYQTDHIATLEKAPAFTALSWNGDTTISGFSATSQTATSTGTGVAVYVGNAAGELTLRKLQAGTGVSLTVSAGAVRITATGGGGSSLGATVTASVFLATDFYRVGADQVVGPRKDTWSTPTGSASRLTFNTATVTTAELAERFKALFDDLVSHGMIGTSLSVATPTAWNPADKGSNQTLTNSNLVLSATSAAWGGVRAARSQFNGDRYYELVITTEGAGAGYHMIGVAGVAASMNSYLGAAADGWAFQLGGTQALKWNNNVSGAYGGSITASLTTGDVVGVRMNIDTGVLTFYYNGASLGAAYTITASQTLFPSAGCFSDARTTARFSSTSWSFAPVGVVQW